MSTPLFTKVVTPGGVLLYGAQGSNASPVQVRNLDSTNQVWVGNVSNISTDGSNSIPLNPGDTVTFNGSVSIYATVISVSVLVAITPGGMAFSPGQIDITGPVTATISGPVTATIPGTVNINGVGGFVLPGQLTSVYPTTSTNVLAGTNVTAGTFNVSNFSSIILNDTGPANNSNAAGAAICAIWQLRWLDTNGNFMARETVSTICGSSISIQIPVKGAQVSLVLQNIGSIGTITFNSSLWGDYRVIPNAKVLSSLLILATVTGWTVLAQSSEVANDIPQWIATLSFSPAVTTNYLLPLPVYIGNVDGWYNISGQSMAHDITIVDLTYAKQGDNLVGTGYAHGLLQNLTGAISANPTNPIQYFSPQSQLAFLFESGAAAGAIQLNLTGD